MESAYLVQRLLSPNPNRIFNPFTFGASGNGGLSKEAIELVSKIWEFDYMGRGEFGKVPEALNRIYEYGSKNKAVTGEIKLSKQVFYLCESDEKEEVEKIIRKIAKNKQNLLEPAFLDEVIRGDKNSKYKGWLELNNGFMFFVNREMFSKTINLFNISCLEKIIKQ